MPEGVLDWEGLPERDTVPLLVLVTEGVRDALRVEEVHTDKEEEGVGVPEREILIVAEGDREGVTLEEVELVIDCGLPSKGQQHRSRSSSSGIGNDISLHHEHEMPRICGDFGDDKLLLPPLPVPLEGWPHQH